MNKNQHILLIINSITDAEIEAIQRVMASPRAKQNKLSLLYLIPSIPACYFQLPSAITLMSQLYKDAQKQLRICAEKLNVDPSNQWIKPYSYSTEVARIARELSADLAISGEADGYGLIQLTEAMKTDSNVDYLPSNVKLTASFDNAMAFLQTDFEQKISA